MIIYKLIFVSLMTSIFCFGCKSKPADPEETSQSTDAPMEKGIALPDSTPDDWPLSVDEIRLLRRNHLKLELKPWETLGFHNREDIVDLAHKTLASDLSPIARDVVDGFIGQLQGYAYQLLGLYGSLEDAERHFNAVKEIVHQGGLYEEPASNIVRHWQMLRSLGFYLMRDHFMPQKERSLMVGIGDCLLSCTSSGTPSCWPYPDYDNGDDSLRRYALNALSYSCSERAKERIKTYTSLPEPDLFLTEGRYDQEEMEKIEKRGDEIRAKLRPVLSEKDLKE